MAVLWEHAAPSPGTQPVECLHTELTNSSQSTQVSAVYLSAPLLPQILDAGNINQLIVSLDSYCEELQKKGGVIGEFVNPKYADAGRTSFKSSTRLECMMQDFPKDLPSTARVGYTSINQVWAAYSPVKNSPADAAAKAAGGNPSHSATTGELDYYKANCKVVGETGV